MFCSRCGHELDLNNNCPNVNCPSNMDNGYNNNQDNSYNTEYNHDVNSEFTYDGVTPTNMTDYIGVKKTEYYMEKWTRYQENPNFISWNWPAFFFNWVWFAYRKMYAYAAIIFASMFVSRIISESLNTLVLLIAMVSSGLLANQLYIKFTIKSIKKILYSIPGMPEQDMKRRLVANGGTTLVPVIIVSILTILFILITIFITVAFVSIYKYDGF